MEIDSYFVHGRLYAASLGGRSTRHFSQFDALESSGKCRLDYFMSIGYPAEQVQPRYPNRQVRARHARAKVDLHQIWMAESRASAEGAMGLFEEKYGAKYPRAVVCLTKDRDALLAFYDFPAEHWVHIRTTNPIESTFATLRHRTKRVKGAFSREIALSMMLQLALEAKLDWHRIAGVERLGQLIEGVNFEDGIAQLAA